MPYLTSSMVEAANTCPRWGVVHSVMGKRFTTGYRQMALEAGSLMHEVFAGLNLLHIGVYRGLMAHMHYHGVAEFDKERWEFIWKETTSKKDNLTMDDRNAFERMVFAIIASSEFYDDPADKNRTTANLERCALALLQYWLLTLVQFPIYVENDKRPETQIGIELSMDTVFETDRGKLRTIGLADVVYHNTETKKIVLGEYKTSTNMNDAWRLSFDTRHQITLYNAMLQAYFGRKEEFDTILVGSAIPVRSTSIPVQHFNVDRDQENVDQLLNTFHFTRNVINEYIDSPLDTPMFTHSCNRYFRPCSLMDLCTATREDQEQLLETMETEIAPSPSERKAMLAILRNM